MRLLQCSFKWGINLQSNQIPKIIITLKYPKVGKEAKIWMFDSEKLDGKSEWYLFDISYPLNSFFDTLADNISKWYVPTSKEYM